MKILLLLLLLLSLLVISHLLTLFGCCHLTNKGVYICTVRDGPINLNHWFQRWTDEVRFHIHICE